MRTNEILLTEMAFPKAVAEAKLRSKEETINLHVVKLLAFDAASGTQDYWRKEILSETQFLSDIAMRVSKGVRRFTAREYYQKLYVEPFEQNEERYINGLIKRAALKTEQESRPLRRNASSVAEMASIIQVFHHDLAQELHAGDNGSDLISRLS